MRKYPWNVRCLIQLLASLSIALNGKIKQCATCMSTAPLPQVLRLCFCIARLLCLESNSYGFCDAYCHGHTRSRPEVAVGSLLASRCGMCLGQTRDSDLSWLSSIPNLPSHLALFAWRLVEEGTWVLAWDAATTRYRHAQHIESISF